MKVLALAIILCGTSLARVIQRSPSGQSACTSQPVGYNNDLSANSLKSGGILRNYTIYIPTSYNDDLTKSWPLIIDYHGNGGDGNQQHNNSRYDSYAPDEYIYVYPNGYDRHWQGPSYAVKGIDDLQFTSDLLSHLKDKYCIDSKRVYASGKSNGGGFVDTLACSKNGNDFLAFAMAAAALYTDLSLGSCPYARTIVEAHGVDDNTIPYSPTKNGSGGALPQIADWVKWWAQRDGCNPNAPNVNELREYEVIEYLNCTSGHIFEHYKVYGLDHCWPSSTGDNYDYENPRCHVYGLDFTTVVLQFFYRAAQ